jgi:hypothetical protein
VEECRAYFIEMSGLCCLFPSTRHAGLLFAGICPRILAGALASYHTSWVLGKLERRDRCPRRAMDFARWMCNNPLREPLDSFPVHLPHTAAVPPSGPSNEGREPVPGVGIAEDDDYSEVDDARVSMSGASASEDEGE